MPWVVPATPLLCFVLATWFLAGMLVNRFVLKMRDGDLLLLLALPIGMMTHLLVINMIAKVIFFPIAVWLSVACTILIGLFVLIRHRHQTLDWSLTRQQRIGIFAAFTFLFIFFFFINAREIWGDDPAHATMTNLIGNGLFPLRFQCNPDFLATYPYGGNLLGAEVMSVSGVYSWNALDIVRASQPTSVALMAFVLGWQLSKKIGGGFILAYLSLTIATMVWVLLPLGTTLFSSVLGNPDFGSTVRQMLHSVWDFSIVTPGFITPSLIYYHRTTSWGFGPFHLLLLWVLLDLPVPYIRKTVILGIVLATAVLTQPSILFVLLPGFGILLILWLIHKIQRRNEWDFNPALLLAISLVIVVIQGGIVTDAVFGASPSANNTTSLSLSSFRLPSCRDGPPSVECLLLSLANLNFVPLLIPLIGYSVLKKQSFRPSTVVLFSGASAGLVIPSFLVYGYQDWNIQRVYTYSAWVLMLFVGLILIPPIYQGLRGRLVAILAIVAISFTGLVATYAIADGRSLQDGSGRGFSPLLSRTDLSMMKYGRSLPLSADIFYSLGCSNITSTPIGLILGRYATSSVDRDDYTVYSAAYQSILTNPSSDLLYEDSYTHLYINETWWRDELDERGRNNIHFGAFEFVGASTDGNRFRALLRVCEPDEACQLSESGHIDIGDNDVSHFAIIDEIGLSAYIGSGWGDIEQSEGSTVRWADQRALFFMPVYSNAVNDTMTLRFRAFYESSTNNNDQTVTISINDEIQAAILLKAGWQEYEIVISGDIIVPNSVQKIALNHSRDNISLNDSRRVAAYDWFMLQPDRP
jgi:hypothetical protein